MGCECNCFSSCSKNNILHWILRLARIVYIAFAIYFVTFGYYKTLMVAKEGRRNLQEEVTVLEKYRYPSITFCNKFKHGQKNVWSLYYLNLLKRFIDSGETDTKSYLNIYISILAGSSTMMI